MSDIRSDPPQFGCRRMLQGKTASAISASGVTGSGSYLAALLASVDQNDVSADRILEDHVSRVWEEGHDPAKVTQQLRIPIFCHSVRRNSVMDPKEGGSTSWKPYVDRSCLPLDPHFLRTEVKVARSNVETFYRDRTIRAKDPRYPDVGGVDPLVGGFSRPNPNESFSRTVNDSKHSKCRSMAVDRSWSLLSTDPSARTPSLDKQMTNDSYSNSSGCHTIHRLENDHRSATTMTICNTTATDVTIVGYYLCEDPIPYRTTLPGKHPTLGQFKQLVTKRGNLRFFFRKASDEFDSGVVHEEITDDNAVLPLWEGKIVGKIELIQ